jgi:hypothetical protein
VPPMPTLTTCTRATGPVVVSKSTFDSNLCNGRTFTVTLTTDTSMTAAARAKSLDH